MKLLRILNKLLGISNTYRIVEASYGIFYAQVGTYWHWDYIVIHPRTSPSKTSSKANASFFTSIQTADRAIGEYIYHLKDLREKAEGYPKIHKSKWVS